MGMDISLPPAQWGRVTLVGAGPGDAELLTLKAARVLAQARLVLFDNLVSPEVMAQLPDLRLTILVGGAAQRWHLGARTNVTETVADWREILALRHMLPLPHPSWRNTGWIRRHPWFAADLLPTLRQRVRDVMEMPDDRA